MSVIFHEGGTGCCSKPRSAVYDVTPSTTMLQRLGTNRFLPRQGTKQCWRFQHASAMWRGLQGAYTNGVCAIYRQAIQAIRLLRLDVATANVPVEWQTKKNEAVFALRMTDHRVQYLYIAQKR